MSDFFRRCVVLGVVAILGGCGGSPSDESGDTSDGGAVDDAPAEVAPSDGGVADVGNFGGDGSVSNNVYGCSGDLQSVVDGMGNVVQQCPADQGCAAGKCVPACQAASAAKGSLGCDFVLATPAFEVSHTPPCFVVFLTNSWTRKVQIGLSRGGTSYDVTQFARVPTIGMPTTSWPTLTSAGLPPNDVAVLFLSSDPNASNGSLLDCPLPDAIDMGTAVTTSANGNGGSTTGLGEAFHVTTDTPVNGYDVIPYGGAKSYLPSAELLLPTTAWGTNYVLATPPNGEQGQLWAQVVAAENATHVTVAPSIALPSAPGVAAAPKGVKTTYTLDAGQYIQWQMPAATTGRDPSGTIVSSDKPVAVNGGNGYFCLASTTSPAGGGCDSEHELVPPVAALGFEYVAAPFATRRKNLMPESLVYRVVGTVGGTTLTYDPPVAGAPSQLDLAKVVDFQATGPFRVASQDAMHPFYIAQAMPGCAVAGGSRPGVDPNAPYAYMNCLGDEDYVGMIPPAQWLQKYVFFADPTYATTNVVLVRQKTPAGAFEDVNVDCLGTVTGWQPVGASGTYQATNVDFIRATQPVGMCNNGPHVATSKGTFALVVWGMDSYSSYGYPAGGSFKTINSVVVPLPSQ